MLSFPDDLPAIYNALTVEFKVENEQFKVTLEVQQHLGDNWVRTVSMSGTEGLKRGFEVTDTGAPISVPVGEGVMGRVFDVTRKPGGRTRTGQGGQVLSDPPPAAALVDQSHFSASSSHRHQGHRFDLSLPERRQGRRVRRRRSRQDRRHHGTDQQHRQAPWRRVGVRRRRRAHPRGQRSLQRNVEAGVIKQDNLARPKSPWCTAR